MCFIHLADNSSLARLMSAEGNLHGKVLQYKYADQYVLDVKIKFHEHPKPNFMIYVSYVN